MSSIKEIAKRAKVSIGTVDRALHGRPQISFKTAEKIRKIAKELNYKPNLFARNLKLKKSYLFGVLIPRIIDKEYWDLHIKGINKALRELKCQKVSVKHFYYYDRLFDEHYAKDIRRILCEKLDGLLIAPIFYDVAEKFIKQLPPDLPYVFLSTKVPQTNYLTHIGQDNFQSGVVAAKLMSFLLREKGTIAIIDAFPSDYHIMERTKGFFSFFNNNPDYSIKIYYHDRTKPESESCRLPETVFNENTELRGVCIPGGVAADFAACLEKQNLANRVCIIGYDLIERSKKNLKNGTIDFIISQNPEAQGYQGIYSLYQRCVLRQSPPKEILMLIDIITRENMDYF